MRIRIVIILLLIVAPIMAQDDLPPLNNYQHNWMIYNPAFTGSRDVMSGGLYMRSLKIKDPGGPFFTQLSAHTPTNNEKVALGLSASIQQSPAVLWPIGAGVDSRYTKYSLFANYAYRIKTSRGRWAFGLSAGAAVTSVSLSEDLLHTDDPTLLSNDIETVFSPNVGAGVLYYTEKLFIGLSIPRLLPSIADLQNGSSDTTSSASFYKKYTNVISGGYEFRINENVTISPSFLLLYGLGEDPLNYAGGINFGMFDKKIWFGTVYKSAKAIAFNANFQLNNQLLLGISYDYSLDINNAYFKNAFEIVLRYERRQSVQTNIPFYY